MISAEAVRIHAFEFERDALAFPNQLFWQYQADATSGEMRTSCVQPPPTYAHRCFIMVRTVRQFLYHARFEPGKPQADADTLRRKIRAVVSRTPRKPSAESERIGIPGWDGLRSFSRDHGALLKSECGGAWQSYTLRSHWRMVLPISRKHQENMARQLVHVFGENPLPIVHVFCFPRISINHGLALFDCSETDGETRFQAYDPNDPSHAVELTYRSSNRTFYFPPTNYWLGGAVKVMEIFRDWLY